MAFPLRSGLAAPAAALFYAKLPEAPFLARRRVARAAPCTRIADALPRTCISASASFSHSPPRHSHPQTPNRELRSVNNPDPIALQARQHYLVIARLPGLDSVSQLGAPHLPLLRHMRTQGQALEARLAARAAAAGDSAAAAAGGSAAASAAAAAPAMRFGFHAHPSMRQLHLHCISHDMAGTALKNKKHYNSFTTAFFVPIDAVIDAVEATGSAAGALPPDPEALLKARPDPAALRRGVYSVGAACR